MINLMIVLLLLINSINILYKTYLFNNLWKYTHSVQHTSPSIHKMLLHCKVEFTSLFFLEYLHTITFFRFTLFVETSSCNYKRQVPVVSLNASLSLSNSSRKYVISDKIFLYPGIERNSRSN